QPDQLAGFAAIVREAPDASFAEMPMLRARITRLDGKPVEAAQVAPEAQWALRSDRGLTYAAEPPAGSHIVAGSWWPADYRGAPLVSFDAELAQGMGLKLGDTLSVNLLGREITATIANLRQIDWARLGINFAIVFAPGAIAAAFLVEHGLLGVVTAVVAAGLGTLAAYALVTGPMRSDWVFLPMPLAAILGLAVILTLVFGFAGTWRALGARPAAYLRNE